ncbi:hypothetical protein EYZ11_000605 [Aspergillus tanneri]|uniref:Uncharacterized protein n=1 Tax=Aspergillus tanneri TaxID=1220188 RepID=A0A4S3JWT6_9EURO|nr:uncharacterized protein ATNIH1004_007707 [Aspergillus tanneri]KAA8646280.1 hypothetical protein ATNIH1004_007707 [Aspergillus tanneri]THC99907.1 hypothetical protein EYZ11_000605 [Aspergillus tanneri]
MASESIGIFTAATAQQDAGTNGVDITTQVNGNNHPTKLDETGHDLNKATEECKHVKTVNPAEETRSGEQISAPASADAQEPTGENKAEQPTTGNKREHESISTPTDPGKATTVASTEPSVAPAAKKQKPDTNTATENGTVPNGEKKKSHSKKVKDTVKKTIPTDGIGSRTRSRTKTAS